MQTCPHSSVKDLLIGNSHFLCTSCASQAVMRMAGYSTGNAITHRAFFDTCKCQSIVVHAGMMKK